MKKKTKLIILNIAAYLFLVLSVCAGRDLSEVLDLLIPGTVLFGSHIYCLKKLPEDE